MDILGISTTTISTQELFYSKQEQSEIQVNYLRMTIAFVLFIVMYSVRGEALSRSFQAELIGIAIVFLSGAIALLYIKFIGYQRWIKYIITILDILILTGVQYAFGGFNTFKSNAFLIYFLILGMTSLRFSTRLTIFSGILCLFCYIGLYVQAIIAHSIELGTIQESLVSSRVSGTNIILNIIFFSAFYFVLVYTSRGYHNLVVSSVEKETEQLRDKHERENKLKSNFMANMSHEIRTPLNSIMGFTQQMEYDLQDRLKPDEQDYFRYIKKSSRRLMQTVHKILDISQIESGEYNQEFSELKLGELIDQVYREHESKAEKKELNFQLNLSMDYDHVNADEYAIVNALSNLVDNAIKYTERGEVEIRAWNQDDYIFVMIRDTGRGISPEYRKRMFEPFSQESEGYTKRFQGVGLGLALTKRYLDLNFVDIDLESRKDEGTSFTLRFNPATIGNVRTLDPQ